MLETLRKDFFTTIGELATAQLDELRRLLGKVRGRLWTYANELDGESVRLFTEQGEIKSISRRMTFQRDLTTPLPAGYARQSNLSPQGNL